MSEVKQPKDAQKRLALKAQLIERMRQSIVEQGSYGVRQTAIWEKVYARAQRFAKRPMPTQSTLKKLLQQLEAAHAWKPTEDAK